MSTFAHSFPIDLPAQPVPRSHLIRPHRVVAGARSPFTLQEQVQLHPGAAWHLEFDYAPMSRRDAARFMAFVLKLDQRYGTFRAGDPDWATPLGAIAAALTVDGAGQTGNLIQAAYAGAALTPRLLLEGDCVQIGDYAYRTLYDTGSDSSGRVSLTLWPPLRATPAHGASIIFNSPTSIFRLDDEHDWSSDQFMTYGFALRATETPPAS